MILKLTLDIGGGASHDVVVDAEAHTPVEKVAQWMAARVSGGTAAPGEHTLVVNRDGRHHILRPDAAIGDAGLRSGERVALSEPSAYGMTPLMASAVLRIVDGPDAGATFDLPSGSSTIGRDRSSDVRLADPMVSALHARVNVGEVIEVVDAQSSNGVEVAGNVVSRVVLGPDDVVKLGGTSIVVQRLRGAAETATHGTVPFVRPPWLDPFYEGEKLKAPEPPAPPQKARLPIATLIAPIFMAAILFFVTKNTASLAFVALSPLMMLGSYFENKRAAKHQYREQLDDYREALGAVVVRMRAAFEREREVRRREHPDTADVVLAAERRSAMLWCRRPDRRSFLDVRLGLGRQPSRSEIDAGYSNRTTPEMWAALQDIVREFKTIDHVPVVASLRESAALGVAGPDPSCRDAARGLIAQLAGLHAPSEVLIGALIPTARIGDWEWLKWLPHSDSEFCPLPMPLLASSGPVVASLVAQLDELIDQRLADDDPNDPTTGPSFVIVIEHDAPIEWARVVSIAERGPAVGVHTIWVGNRHEDLPSICQQFIVVDHNTAQIGTGNVHDGSYLNPIEVGRLNAADAACFAKGLAPLVDAGALLDDSGGLPAAVSFAAESGPSLLSDPHTVIERWRQSNSIGPSTHDPNSRRDRSLRAFVGMTSSGPMMLDLRTHGPHALVGGTTGAGKSEFLQTWILGMATALSPERVNFLLVDYKGGSAFGPCADLPHAVGLVTDLNQRLVRRVLESMRAELVRREHLLNRWKAKDLLDLESKEPDGAPVVPSLVIVVDEFAALIQEIPEFVDGMIDIAQRGRSLGLHLVLATQQPAGVIKGKLRANTNLRVALRMADAEDSSDVVGSPLASEFDPSLPGRAVAKTGPGKLLSFQTAYVGGHTTGEAPPPRLVIADLPFERGTEWVRPVEAASPQLDPGEKDLHRMVQTVRSAYELAAMEAPYRPWLDELAKRYELSQLPTRRVDSELVVAVLDDPSNQDQTAWAFEPDVDGNLAVFGTGGTGKSTLLRSVAIASGLSYRGGPTAVYGLDFGARGLAMLEKLPHVGSIISGDDDERISRLIRDIRLLIDDRAVRYAAVNAGSIDDYRKLTNTPDEPRILLLVDNAGAFRTAYEVGPRARTFEALQSIAMDGRAVGVHVVLSADRVNAVPSSLLSVIPTRLVMRTADDNDLLTMGVPADAFDETSPPGRAYHGTTELQVAVLAGDDASIASQAQAIEALSSSMSNALVLEAPPIERLPDRVHLEDLPTGTEWGPTIGLLDETLGPWQLHLGGTFVVCGPPQSGKTTALLTLIDALRRWNERIEMYFVGSTRSEVGAQQVWAGKALGPGQVAELAERLREVLRGPEERVARTVLFIESIGDFLQTEADLELQDLVRELRTAGATVISEAETAVIAQSWPLFKEARASRHGIALQPDQMDGDNVFGTALGRVARAEFPEGRGMYVRAGRAKRVQLATP